MQNTSDIELYLIQTYYCDINIPVENETNFLFVPQFGSAKGTFYEEPLDDFKDYILSINRAYLALSGFPLGIGCVAWPRIQRLQPSRLGRLRPK